MKTKDTVTYKILFIYIFTHYIIQIFIHNIYYEKLLDKFNGVNYSFLYVLFSIIFFLIIFFIVNRVIPFFYFSFKIKKISNIKSFLKWIFLILFFISALNFSMNYGLNFRHSNRLSETGFLVQILGFLRIIAIYIVFTYFTYIIRGNLLLIKDRIYLFILFFSYSLCITGSLHVVFLPIVLMLVFLSNNKLKIILINQNISMKKAILFFGIALIISIGVVFVGIANKIGVEKTFNLFIDSEMLDYILSLVSMRVSTSYFSLLIMAHDHIFNYDLQFNIYMMHLQNFLDRLMFIMSISDYTNTQEIQSINRFNYLILFKNDISNTAGAAPGLIASIFYLPIFPINFLLMSIYLVMIFRILNIYIGYKKLSFIAIVIIYYFLFVFFEAPPLILRIIDPMSLYFTLFIFGVFFIKQDNDKIKSS